MEVIPLFLLIVFVCMIICIIIAVVLNSKKGKIEIILDKYSFNSGEEVTGKVILKLKKDVVAKELNVAILAVNQNEINKKSYNLFESYQPLDGEKTYLKGDREYPFRLPIPTDVINKYKMNSPLAEDLMKGVSTLTGIDQKMDWYISASFEILGLNLSEKVKINVI